MSVALCGARRTRANSLTRLRLAHSYLFVASLKNRTLHRRTAGRLWPAKRFQSSLFSLYFPDHILARSEQGQSKWARSEWIVRLGKKKWRADRDLSSGREGI